MDRYDSHIGEMFFRPKYSMSGTLYMHVATLANYFDYPFAECPFGDCTQIPSFRITTGKAYTFKPGQRIVVPAKITFWCEGSDTVTLIDTDVGRACWGLCRTLPSGKRESVAASKDFTRGSPRVTVHRLTHGQSYDRSLDLGEIADFSAKGTYHVQLLYESFGPTGLAKGAWPGSFSGPVFDVKR